MSLLLEETARGFDWTIVAALAALGTAIAAIVAPLFVKRMEIRHKKWLIKYEKIYKEKVELYKRFARILSELKPIYGTAIQEEEEKNLLKELCALTSEILIVANNEAATEIQKTLTLLRSGDAAYYIGESAIVAINALSKDLKKGIDYKK